MEIENRNFVSITSDFSSDYTYRTLETSPKKPKIGEEIREWSFCSDFPH